MSSHTATRPADEHHVQGSPVTPAPPRVAWGLVTSCALAMVLADGFLVVALRSVAGSIERTDHLFLAWVRESVLLLPAYVVAVLAALMLTQRLHPRAPLRRSATAVTLGLISLAGTLAGMLWATASAAYDYRLQQHELLDMPAMLLSCTGTCPEQMQHAALVLQERALGLAAVAFLVGNLLVVLWVYALRGGVLLPRARTGTGGRWQVRRAHRPADLQLVMGAGLLGAALIHLAVVPEHLTEWPLAGAFFVVLAVLELGAAGLVVLHRSPILLATVGLLSLLPVLLWAFSRTKGLPFGPESGAAEAIGFADVAACALELVTLVACLVMLRAGGWVRRPAASPYGLALVGMSLVAVTALGLGGSGLPGVHAFGAAGHDEDQEETSVPSTRLPGTLVPPPSPTGGSDERA